MKAYLQPPVTDSARKYIGLLEVSRSIASHRDFGEIFHDLAGHLHALVDFNFFVLFLYDPARNVMRLHMVRSANPGRIEVGNEYGMDESAAAFVWKTQQPLLIEDTAAETRFPSIMKDLRDQGVRSVCIFPLTSAHRRLGTLNFGSETPGTYKAGELDFLQLVTSQVAVAVDNALHFQEAQNLQSQLGRDRDRLQLLLDLNNRLVSNLDLRELFLAISSSVRRTMGCDYASLSLPGADPEKLRFFALDFPESKGFYREDMVYPMDGSPSGAAFKTMKPIALQNPFTGWPQSPVLDIMKREGLNNFCFVPLLSGNQSIATLNLGRFSTDLFTEQDLYFLNQAAAQIAIAVENALDYRRVTELRARLDEERRYLKDEIRTEHNFDEIIGESPILRRVLNQVETVAPTNSTVLIQGETGTGKELIARAIHNLSSRRDDAFVKVNCAAIPLGLIESELFGHERGAFTGAIAQKAGRFELANGGTLFLDEVGDIPLELQPKLLRVLQEQEFERLGGTRTMRVDVRIVAATSRNLEQMVGEGTFRGDLYYRFNVFPVMLPSLRERPDDIPMLVRHFVAKYARLMNKKISTVPDEAMEALRGYPWPGNIRELQNFIERAVILTPGPTLRPPLSELKRLAAPRTRSGTLEDVEREHILQTLQDTKWVVGGPRGAAARLGLKRTSLVYKMQRLGISRESR
ncbi:MAG TPA: sigma 54-interacting transcriptional regulator [Candidatus Acidoferrales bacterium]|nr:sigma 54-interacting transcriptional regulator [Candidatus Acidoferrales bacterium]